ncbi:Phd_YefM [Roseovarius litorisediminis]|uniref:Antitoxin n=1 Tax=Roseovarius litorisediminis TaxID=1312363 RepID=A0A1Y5TAQ0_9RHOB|nr:type II toxin-antitoxin system Phd/YefM family antitoxin [Roseovarius litorisediminis]SLN59659.1 Phd_YefM [Roseovarius litorisediminis]
MHIELRTSKLRTNLSAYLDHHAATGDRILLFRNGRPVAALVSPKDMHALEKVDGSREELLERRQAAQMREFRMLKNGLL